jgi:hypothetical protein
MWTHLVVTLCRLGRRPSELISAPTLVALTVRIAEKTSRKSKEETREIGEQGHSGSSERVFADIRIADRHS